SASAARSACRLRAACRRCRGRAAGSAGSTAGPGLDLLDHVAGPDLVNDLHPRSHPAEHGVAAVEMGRGGEGDEELAAARVLAGEGHPHHAAAVGPLADLVAQREPGAAVAVAAGIAALHHE